MSLWIKICGNTTFEDALLATEAGADAVGFVFAASPRRVTAEQARAICAKLPPIVEKIGVFVDDSVDQISSAVEACGLTGVQLHFAAPPDLAGRLRARFGPHLRLLSVVHFGKTIAEELALLNLQSGVDAVLIDSKTPHAVGGTGVAFDWEASARLFENAAHLRFVAAGGLTPLNVTEAIRQLRPWGVDTVSGVESAPGRKDPAKVRAFLAAARAATLESQWRSQSI